MNEKWRDYSKYTDKQLDDLLKGFAGQGDYAAVAFEYQRRQNARQEADNKSRHANFTEWKSTSQPHDGRSPLRC